MKDLWMLFIYLMIICLNTIDSRTLRLLLPTYLKCCCRIQKDVTELLQVKDHVQVQPVLQAERRCFCSESWRETPAGFSKCSYTLDRKQTTSTIIPFPETVASAENLRMLNSTRLPDVVTVAPWTTTPNVTDSSRNADNQVLVKQKRTMQERFGAPGHLLHAISPGAWDILPKNRSEHKVRIFRNLWWGNLLP